MSAPVFDERLGRLNKLSDGVFGEAAEVDSSESEELLRAAGIDPDQLKGAMYQRMRETGREYSEAGKPLPPLLKRALEDLQPPAARHLDENDLARTAEAVVARLLEEVRNLPSLLLDGHFTPVFTAAYRKKKQLSPRDKKLLDDVADELQKRVKGPKGK
jgi:hypothetical protein